MGLNMRRIDVQMAKSGRFQIANAPLSGVFEAVSQGGFHLT